MTIEELIIRYGNANDKFDIKLIKMYARSALCEVCPLEKQCPVKWEAIQKCVNYLASVLEVEQ